MVRFLALIICSIMAMTQLSFAAKPDQNAGVQAGSGSEIALGSLPPAPRGESTVIGGTIRGLDPVRDQFTLRVFGGGPMKILFDERTQVYRDGVKTHLRDLRPGDHASVETVPDGTNVFASSIHMLSQTPEGECQGQVLNYNPRTGELTVRDALTREPLKLQVPAGTAVVRAGGGGASSARLGPADLVTGTLISAKFDSDNAGHGIASRIAILASPGSSFVFNGNVAFLDLHTGQMVLVDSRDGRSYSISFDSARLPMSRQIHEGKNITVTADFDGARYQASAIKIE